jgi:hypothetical protein
MLPKLPPIDVLAGRACAMCAHPYAAWRTRSNRGRAAVLFAYMAGGYLVALSVLFLAS